ncbi:MAG: cyclase [Chloroflexi bacterium]|nr:cyclase [Chloroflexota bacterium]
MASLFMRHRVADYEKWKRVFDGADDLRKNGAGAIAHNIHRDPDDPNLIIVALRVHDIRRAKEFAASPDLLSAMAEAGVQGQPEVWFGEDVEDRRY